MAADNGGGRFSQLYNCVFLYLATFWALATKKIVGF